MCRFLASPGSKQQLGMSSCSSSWEALVVIVFFFCSLPFRTFRPETAAFTSGIHWTPYGCIFGRFDGFFLLSAVDILNFVFSFSSVHLTPSLLKLKTTIKIKLKKKKNTAINDEKYLCLLFFLNLSVVIAYLSKKLRTSSSHECGF